MYTNQDPYTLQFAPISSSLSVQQPSSSHSNEKRQHNEPQRVVQPVPPPPLIQQYINQTPHSQQRQQVIVQSNDSGFVSKMLGKRREFMKLITLSFMILLALSINIFVLYFIKRFDDSSETVQYGIRLLYIMATLVILWLLKAYN
jgi:hypothetical protein